jgi:hypothetical protein
MARSHSVITRSQARLSPISPAPRRAAPRHQSADLHTQIDPTAFAASLTAGVSLFSTSSGASA